MKKYNITVQQVNTKKVEVLTKSTRYKSIVIDAESQEEATAKALQSAYEKELNADTTDGKVVEVRYQIHSITPA